MFFNTISFFLPNFVSVLVYRLVPRSTKLTWLADVPLECKQTSSPTVFQAATLGTLHLFMSFAHRCDCSFACLSQIEAGCWASSDCLWDNCQINRWKGWALCLILAGSVIVLIKQQIYKKSPHANFGESTGSLGSRKVGQKNLEKSAPELFVFIESLQIQGFQFPCLIIIIIFFTA